MYMYAHEESYAHSIMYTFCMPTQDNHRTWAHGEMKVHMLHVYVIAD